MSTKLFAAFFVCAGLFIATGAGFFLVVLITGMGEEAAFTVFVMLMAVLVAAFLLLAAAVAFDWFGIWK